MSEMTLNPNTVPPMPDPYQPSTMDSAFASWCAALAYLTGRTQLGSELGKVALRAKLYELRQGQTALMLTPQVPIFEAHAPAPVDAPTTPWLDPDASQPIPAYPDPIQTDPSHTSTRIEAPETARCASNQRRFEGAQTGECHAVVVKMWENGTWWWSHVDPALNDDHAPVGPGTVLTAHPS